MFLRFGLDAHGITSMGLRVVVQDVDTTTAPNTTTLTVDNKNVDIANLSLSHHCHADGGTLNDSSSSPYMPIQESTTHESEVRAYVVFRGIPNHVSLPSFINELEPFWPAIRRLRCIKDLLPQTSPSPTNTTTTTIPSHPTTTTSVAGYAVLAELSVVGSQEDDDDYDGDTNTNTSTTNGLMAMTTMLSDISEEYDNRAHDTLGGGGGGTSSTSSNDDVAAVLRVFIVSSPSIHLYHGGGGGDDCGADYDDDGTNTTTSSMKATLQDILGDGEDERSVSPQGGYHPEAMMLVGGGGGNSPISQPSSASLRGSSGVPTSALPPPPKMLPTPHHQLVDPATTTANTTNSNKAVVEGSCSICLERLFTFPCVTTLCCHTFHIHCYSRTLPQCPLCRFDLSCASISTSSGGSTNPAVLLDRVAIKDRVLGEATTTAAAAGMPPNRRPSTSSPTGRGGDSNTNNNSGSGGDDGVGGRRDDDRERIATFRRLFQGVVSLDRIGSGMVLGTPTQQHPPRPPGPTQQQQQPLHIMRCSECDDPDHTPNTNTASTPPHPLPQPNTTTTSSSTSSISLWMCLMCGHVGCGRSACGHGRTHYEATGHRFAIDVYGPRVWDYRREMYVHRVVQQAVLAHSNNNTSDTNINDNTALNNSDEGTPHPPCGGEGVNDDVTPNSVQPSPSSQQHLHQHPAATTTATPTSKHAAEYPPSGGGGGTTRNGGGGGGLWVDYGFNDHEDRARLLSSVELVSDFYSKLLNHQLRAQQCHYETLLVDAGMQGDMGSLIQNELATRMLIIKESRRDVIDIATGFKEAMQGCRRHYVARIKKMEQDGVGPKASSSSTSSTNNNTASSSNTHSQQKMSKKGGGGGNISSSSKSESAGLETDRIALDAAKANIISLQSMKASLLKKEGAHVTARDTLQAQLDALQADTMKLMEHF